jgi:hypothetical protein
MAPATSRLSEFAICALDFRSRRLGPVRTMAFRYAGIIGIRKKGIGIGKEFVRHGDL